MYDASELGTNLLEALAYAAAGLDQLDRHAELWPKEREGEGGGLLRRRDKVAAEALLLAFLASRVAVHDPADAGLARAVDGLTCRAEREIATGRNEALLRRFPNLATTLGQGFVLLERLGRGRPEILRLLRRAFERGWATASERVPYRLMDSRWTYGLLDPSLLGPPDELARFSILGARPHPLHTMSEDDYALTHALFYLTDFGRAAPEEDLRRRASKLLEPYLAWNAVRGDLDLLGELLISALVVRAPASPAFRFGWEVLRRAWRRPGGLVGPEYSGSRFAELEGAEADAYAFSENYHTVFVGGILCAVALARPRSEEAPWRQPAEPAESAEGAGAPVGMSARGRRVWSGTGPPPLPLPGPDDLPEWTAARLLSVLGQDRGPAPPWLAAAAESALTRGELAVVLHDALLIAAGRNYRLVQLAEALAVAARHPALQTPTLGVALQLLLDQQLDDGFVGIHRLLAQGDPAPPAEEGAAEAQRVLVGLIEEIGRGLAA
jgi:hypothetical protein